MVLADRVKFARIRVKSPGKLLRARDPKKGVRMKRCLLSLVLVATVWVASCRKCDIRTVVVDVPGLKNAACAKIIQDAFMRQPGIQSVQPDFQQHKLTVTYDSMIIALKNIEFVIAGAGFDANDTPALPEAIEKLPPECGQEPGPG